jgi:hypothetical protein
MAAEKGNQWWRLRAKHGRDAIFTDPQKLLESCYEYFEATSKRKWTKKDWVGKDAFEVTRETDTPYTLTGLCIFLDINTQYFGDFKLSETYKSNKDFSLVISHVEQIIETQQIEGAMVGTFNHNIVARKLGLIDKQENSLKLPSSTIVVQSQAAKEALENL